MEDKALLFKIAQSSSNADEAIEKYVNEPCLKLIMEESTQMIKDRWDSYQVTTPKMNERVFAVPSDEQVLYSYKGDAKVI